MTSTNLKTFFNNPSTSREYTTVSSGPRNNSKAPERLSDKDDTDNLRLERSKEVKQYKGKRDPSKPLASVRLQTTDSGGNMLRSYNGPNTAAASSPDVVGLVFSNTSSSSSKSTICNEELIASSQMSTSTDASVSSAQNRLNQIENEKRKKLMEAALMAIDRDFPCMTTVDRVMNWKIADDLDEVEEFSSSASEKLQQPYTSYGKMYDTVKEHWSKDQKKVRRPLNSDIYAFRQKSTSSVIKLRYEYGGKSTETKTSATATQNLFKVPDVPSADNAKQEVSSTDIVAANVLSGIVSPESPTNHRDELFNYLQIDTNLSHARTTQSDSSNSKRRSLRVKVQQSAASKSVKYNKEIEIEKKKVDELEQQVKKHLSMSLASGGTACRFGIWGARKFHSKMNSMKTMNKGKSSTCGKETNVCGESQTSSAPSSCTKAIDEVIDRVGSSNEVTTTTRKRHKLMSEIENESPASLLHTILPDLGRNILNCSLNEVDGNILPEHGSRSIVRRTRRHSVNSMNVDPREEISLKRRFSDNIIDFPKRFINVTVMLENIDTTAAIIIPKRLKSTCDYVAQAPLLHIAATEDVPMSIVEIPPCLSPAPANTSNPKESVSSPTPDPPFIVIPESVCSSSAISPYPITTSESERNIHSMSSNDVVVENLDDTLQKTEPVIVVNATAVTKSTTNVSNLVKVTYVHLDESALNTTAQRSTQYKSVLLQDTTEITPRTCITPHYNNGSSPASTGATPTRPTCVLERINYRIPTTPNVNPSNASYTVKILVSSKDTAAVLKQTASLSKPIIVTKELCPPKVDHRKLVNSIFKKTRPNGKNNRSRTAEVNPKMKILPKVVTLSTSPTIKEKKSSAVVLDEQKIAINQLKALGDQYSEPVEKQKLSITAVQRFLKSRPLRSIRRNIRKATFRRISANKGLLPGRPFASQHVVKSSLPSAIVYSSPTSTSTPQISTKSIETPQKYANENVSSETIDSTTAPGIPLPNSDSSSGGRPSTRTSDTPIIPSLQSSFTDFMMPISLPLDQISTPKLSPIIKKNFNDSPVSSTTSRESADSAIGTSDQNIRNMTAVAFGRTGTTTTTMNRSHSENSNPLNPSNGAVLAALYLGDTIIIVQESEVSFWKYPSRIYSIFGMVQNWELIGSAERQNSDIEVETPYQNRICSNEGRPAYVEFRAKQFPPTESRECYLASIYLNVYFIDELTQESVVHHVDLDRIMGNASSVRYTVLTESRYLVMSWTEQAIGNGTKCGLCKYSLSPDLDTLASVRDFASLQHNIKSLTCFGDDKLLGFGYSVVTMWDHQTGDLLLNIDIDLPIGDNLGCFLSSENDDKYMFLVQHFNASGVAAQYLKLMAINLSDCFSWKVVHTHELPVIYKSVTSTAITADSLTVTFKNGESLLLSLFNPRQIYMREPKTNIDTATGIVHHQQSFVQNDKIFQISPHGMVIKAVYEHFLESDK